MFYVPQHTTLWRVIFLVVKILRILLIFAGGWKLWKLIIQKQPSNKIHIDTHCYKFSNRENKTAKNVYILYETYIPKNFPLQKQPAIWYQL